MMQLPEQSKIPDNKQQLLDQQAIDLLCLHDSPVVRAMYLGVGFLALFLGALGAFLPILPTTPFILLAAACFARGSEHFHRKLLENRFAGPIILEWTMYHSIPRHVKRWVYLLITFSFSSSILIVPEMWQKIMLIVMGCCLLLFIWRIPIREKTENKLNL